MVRYKQIALRIETYKRLTAAGTKNQTYDEIVSWLLDIWQDKIGENLSKVKT